MAEFVQQSIEEMLPELEQMERVGLFSAGETRKILRKRKAYEYKLRRKTKEKQDFLQYIQYEMNVLNLVRKRRERTGYRFKRMEIDVAVVQRIHRLFRLASWRFPDDVTLYLSHVEFCKKRKEKSSVSRLFTKLLSIHNKKPELWVLAAQYEIEEVLSMETARGLLQRGLRFNPQSQHLWQEYLRMELMNTDKMRKRREVLGLGGLEESDEEMSDAVLQGQIAAVAYQQAAETFPGDVEFCLSCLELMQQFDFTSSLQDNIYEELKSTKMHSEIVWDALARRHLQQGVALISGKKKTRESQQHDLEMECLNTYTTALKTLNNEKMWSLCTTFCVERVQLKSSSRLRDKRVSSALTVFAAAAEAGHCTEDMMLCWIELLQKTGRIEELEKVVVMGTNLHPSSASLWLQRLQLLVLLRSVDGNADKNEVITIFNKAMTKVKDEDALDLWRLVWEWCLLQGTSQQQPLLEAMIQRTGVMCVAAKEEYIYWAALKEGLSTTRKLYTRLSASQPLSSSFFTKYIAIEESQPMPRLKHIRRAYEDCLSYYGDSHPDLWLDLMQLELKHGQAELVGQIHWRAMKALRPDLTQDFITKVTMLHQAETVMEGTS